MNRMYDHKLNDTGKGIAGVHGDVQTRVRDMKVVGRGVHVKDAVEKVTGSIKYAVDMTVQNMAHGKILRCPHPHARIRKIDTSKAENLSGVYGVLTHEDVPQNDWEAAWFNYRGKVLDGIGRFVGDDLAAVAAESEEIAQRAIDLIEVEYEHLEAVFDMEEARKPGAPQVRVEGNERDPYIVKWGDTDKGKELAEHVVECDINYHSQQYALWAGMRQLRNGWGTRLHCGLHPKLPQKHVTVFMRRLAYP